MTRMPLIPNPKLDLVLERVVDVPRELVWKAWTMPEHVAKWFTPKPWDISDCEIDLRPGGIFRTVMHSPDGEQSINLGCYLEDVPNERLVWTDALVPGYRPSHERDKIYRDGDAPRRSDPSKARGYGLLRWLGDGARSTPSLCEHDMKRVIKT
jgi:hypothetical protein